MKKIRGWLIAAALMVALVAVAGWGIHRAL